MFFPPERVPLTPRGRPPKKTPSASSDDFSSPLLREFSDRLTQALEHAGHPGHGGQTWLGKKMCVTQTSARRWLLGKAFPEFEKLHILSDLLDVRLEWLITGQGTMLKNKRAPSWVPQIAWEDISRWLSRDRNAVPKIDDFPFPGPLGSDAFVLAMRGSSMDPDIKNGDFIVIDPLKPWSDQDFVLAGSDPGTETIRKVEMDGGRPVLFLSNLKYPSQVDVERTRILGTVVGRITLYPK